MFQLIISPKNGWEDIEIANRSTKELLSSGLYPMMGLASVACFMSVFIKTDVTLVVALQNAIITFIRFFATYFFAVLIFSMLITSILSVPGEPYISDEKKYTTFIIYNLGILTFIAFLQNIIAIDLSILQFLPFFVVFIMWKGEYYLCVPANKIGQFMFLSVFSILVPSYLLQYIFQYILP